MPQDAARTASLQQRGSTLQLLALQLHAAEPAIASHRAAARDLLAALFRRPADEDAAGACSCHMPSLPLALCKTDRGLLIVLFRRPVDEEPGACAPAIFHLSFSSSTARKYGVVLSR